MRRRFLLVFYALAFISIDAHAEVVFHDAFALKGEPAMLKAETKGKLFSRGGEIVEFSVNGKSIGKTLSGGDGFAFKQFIPAKTGLYKIAVRSGRDENNGLLMSLKEGDRIVFIDVEGSLLGEPFSKEPRKGSQKAVKEISKRFPLVYLHRGIFSVKAIKEWLKKNEFIGAPVIPWQQGAIFNEITEKGLKIKAIIGSQPVIESAKELKPRAFSFEEVEGAEEVKDWEEIWKRLRQIDRTATEKK